jgi:dTDP-3-amino-3,4,6-trideoxy-alpha-D-glucose transaminase
VIAARIPFAAPAPHEEAPAVRAAIDRVIASGRFILGAEVEAFESEFAAAQGAAFAVGVGNGTDALALILRALDVGPGDEVITAPLTAAFTALAIMMTGAKPVFADIDDRRLTLDPDAVERAVTVRTRAIMPVHLYGQAADMDHLRRVASTHNIPLVEDCCQAHLTTSNGRPVGTIGAAGAFSFYPTKNLGALGDGGAVVTDDRALAERIKRLRNGGQTDRYHHAVAGVNSRLDELQAAVLRARLPFLTKWTARRRALAARYRATLNGSSVTVPAEFDSGHVYHLFVVRSGRRAELQAHLSSRGVDTLVHYPLSLTRQDAFAAAQPRACPIAEQACNEVLSLPLHPSLTDSDVDAVSAAVNQF